MKAEVYYLVSPYQLEFIEEEIAPIGRLDIFCETEFTAISPGTELSAYIGLPPLRPGSVYPRLQGYCNVATVIEVGQSVVGVKPGDRVLTTNSHRSHFLTVEREIQLILRKDDNPKEFVLSYLFHLGYNAILRSNLSLGSNVLVIGLGVLGLASIAMAKQSGSTVIGISDNEKPTEIAFQYGAHDVLTRKLSENVLEIFGNKLADVVIVTTNSWTDWEIALKSVGKLGVIACLGFPGRGENSCPFNPLDSQYFYDKQIKIEAVGFSPEFPDDRGFARFNEKDNLEFIGKILRSKSVDASLINSGTYNSENLEQAYKDLLVRKNSPITYLLKWKN